MRNFIHGAAIVLLVCVCWTGIWWGLDSAALYARELGRQQAMVTLKSYDATRTEPPVVLIQRATPDYAQVCVEPAKNGIVACRPISDLRKWILSPAAPPCPPVMKK
jgi:hypothetical protein